MHSNATKSPEERDRQKVTPEEQASVALQRRLSPVTEERIGEICECVLDIVAALFNVSGRELRETRRSSTSVTRVRQIGMYAAHVVLGLNMTEVGRGFGRDRTTVQYACHIIEDMRDDEEFDRIVLMTERVTAAAFRNMEVR
ncbi:helix-turn-helix domain-containing protein [uncultured Nitratireductor sp.]|uniref:helix-turn-helix domain-containing protein n=1 Tax=uncultured Nitratireductor sp. TaxID=520953 RepID=UPI0025EAEB8D|nr:helix-turn-helix domain-containing protein [uncultured Nitratireductor sp.]